MANEEFVNVRPMAKELHVSPAALYQAIAKGHLPHYRIGRRVLLKRTEVLEALKITPNGKGGTR